MTEHLVRDGGAMKQTVTNSWLQRRGHLAPPGFLTKQQKQDFQDCFLLLDTEKTGRLNVDNLTSAFQLLNIETCSSDVRELIAAVDRKGTGYISYDDFEAVMARSLLQHTRPVEAAVDLSATIRLQPDSSALPFHEIARAFRRKKLMAEVMGGGKSRQQLLNRHADRYANDETDGRSMLAMKLHLEIQRLRDAKARAKQKSQSPRKPVTIRLGSIAKHLPLEMRLAVADAVAYDPPASGVSTERLPPGSSPPASVNQGAPHAGPSSPHEEEESKDRVPGGREVTAASSQQLPRGNSSSGSSAQGVSGGDVPGGRTGGRTGGRSPPGSVGRLASQRISWAATDGQDSQMAAESSGQSHSSQLSSQQAPFAARPEPMTKQQREQGARQHGPVSIHFAQSPESPQSPKPGSPAAHLAPASSASHRSSLPEVPLLATVSQAQRWVSKYEEEAPEVTVEPAFSIPTTAAPPPVESEMAPNSDVAGESAEFGGKVKMEENIWGGLVRSTTAPTRIMCPTLMLRKRLSRGQQAAEVGLPSMARQQWQDSLQQPSFKVRAMHGSGGSLNAAALLTLAGQKSDPVVPQLNVTRAGQGKSGLTYREEICF
ncbi:hypothetical protein WJX82_005787 [Trebouxia sp. C0006]